jgi:GNAT superfamily N-acetyltransferase
MPDLHRGSTEGGPPGGRSFAKLCVNKCASAWRLMAADPVCFLVYLAGSPTLWRVYATSTGTLQAPPLPQGIQIRQANGLDWEHHSIPPAVRALIDSSSILHRPDNAYLLFVGGRCAHISWLVPWNESRPLGLKPGEAEIRGCYTEPEFRGQGLYPMMVAYLAEAAARQGIGRIYMKTSRRNFPSQRGILKAGLRHVGSSLQLQFSYISPNCGLYIRFFRWRGPGKPVAVQAS